MKTPITLIFIILSLLQIGSNRDNDLGKYILTTCPIPVPQGLVESGKFSYGYMKVPEFSNKPNGNAIELAVAIFKCKSDTATHKPLVLCAGGPGSSNMDTFIPDLTADLGELFLYERDIVIIESRGLKYSKPYLVCPGLEELQLSLVEKNLTADETIDLYLDTLQFVYNKFIGEGVNLSAFNSLEISNEIVYVMKRLGYEKFSLFGTSYGTMLAQYLLLNHSDRLVSVVMNGTMDLNRGGYDMHTNMINKLDSIFEKRQDDHKYAAEKKKIKSRFLDLLKRLNEKPDTIMAKYGSDGKTYKIILNGNRLSVWLFNQMYANTQIPLTIHKILSGDYSEIIESPGLIFPLHDFSMGLSLSVFLSETPDIKPNNIPIDGEYADLVRGCGTSLFTPYFWNKAKNVWKVNSMDANKSIVTSVPILMLAGKMDYLCLPSYAIEFSKRQKNSYLYIFEGVAHSPVDAGPCAIMMMKEFIDNPAIAPDNSCMKQFQHEFMLPE